MKKLMVTTVFVAMSLAAASSKSALGTPVLVAGWNFNNQSLTVSHGSGTLTTDVNGFNFSASSTNPVVGGTTLNLVAGDAAGRRLQAPPRFLNQNQGGRYLQFDLDLTGYQDLTMSWAMYVQSGYTNPHTIQYRVGNSGAFTTFGTFSPPSGEGNWAVRSADFSSTPAIDDQALVQFRLVLPSAGDWNAGAFYDNFQFNAVQVPEPGTMAVAGLLALGGLGLRRRWRPGSSPESGRA